jgi:putative transposase
VHLVRQSLQYVAWSERKPVCAALRAIYQAPSEATARDALARFATSPLGQRHAPIVALWERHWERVAPALAYPMPIRRVLYTTNAIESLHMQIRKILKTRGHFPTDEAAGKLLYLALRNIGKKRNAKPDKHWRAAFPHLKLLFGDRLQDSM